MSRSLLCPALLLLAACAGETGPTAPADPAVPPDLAGAAFKVTIDVATGRVAVAPPAEAAGTGPSLSLVGSEAVALQMTSCTWSSVPSNSKQKRCSFDLALRNRLQQTDLLTPTSFPRPPQGADGILVFPYTAAALGVPGGSATPSPDWDNAPYNFFNDFGGCSGKNADCYRWESYPGPLYGGETTEARRVGFDVDKNAQSVAVYIVVAADIRENPVRQLSLAGTSERCGFFNDDSERMQEPIRVNPGQDLVVGWRVDAGELEADRGFCSFALPAELEGKAVVRATLRLFQKSVTITPFQPVVVDHVDFGTVLDAADMFSTPLQQNIGTISDDAALGARTLDVSDAVDDDLAAGRPASEFRLRFLNNPGDPDEDGIMTFAGTSDPTNSPELSISYRTR